MNDTHIIIAELHRQHADDLFSAGARLALELECLLMDTRDAAVQSRVARDCKGCQGRRPRDRT